MTPDGHEARQNQFEWCTIHIYVRAAGEVNDGELDVELYHIFHMALDATEQGLPPVSAIATASTPDTEPTTYKFLSGHAKDLLCLQFLSKIRTPVSEYFYDEIWLLVQILPNSLDVWNDSGIQPAIITGASLIRSKFPLLTGSPADCSMYNTIPHEIYWWPKRYTQPWLNKSNMDATKQARYDPARWNSFLQAAN